jgi:hypothetical protein
MRDLADKIAALAPASAPPTLAGTGAVATAAAAGPGEPAPAAAAAAAATAAEAERKARDGERSGRVMLLVSEQSSAAIQRASD